MKLRGEIPVINWANESLAVNPRAFFCLGPEIFTFSPESFRLRLEVEFFHLSFSFLPFEPAIEISGLPKRIQRLCRAIVAHKQAEEFNKLADVLARGSYLNIEIEEEKGVVRFVLALSAIASYLVLTPVEIPAFLFLCQQRPLGVACC